MNMRYILAALSIAAILVISGCASPSPSPSPSVIATPTISPTATPTAIATVSPTPIANVSPSATAVPTATVSPTAVPTVAATGALTASGITIVSDTSDPLQHDTAQMTLNNTGTSVLSDVTVTYTVVFPYTVANPDGSTTTSNQTATSTAYVGKMSPAEVKSVTIKSPDHAKNVPASVTIKATWKGGEQTLLQTTIQAPDNTMTTRSY